MHSCVPLFYSNAFTGHSGVCFPRLNALRIELSAIQPNLRRMRIAFDAKRYFHNNTGLGRYSRELVDGLSRYYPENDYLLCNPRNSGRIDLHDGFKLLAPTVTNALYAAYWRSAGVVRELKKQNARIYHGLSNEIPFGLRTAKIRSAVSVHDMIYLRYPHLYKRADRWIYERKVEFAATHADAVIATSQQTADDISFFYPVRSNRIVVVYQAVNMPQPTVQEDQAVQRKYELPQDYFLYVGTVEERKNLIGVLQAMQLSQNRKQSLAVVGKHHPAYHRECVDFIRKHGMQKQVGFYDGVTRDELASFYKNSTALVYPSYFEGFGIPIVEAHLCGTPVITSVGGCFAETAAEAALFVNPAEPQEIADAMHKLENEPSLRRLLVTRGAENAKRFTSEKFAASVMDVYKQLA